MGRYETEEKKLQTKNDEGVAEGEYMKEEEKRGKESLKKRRGEIKKRNRKQDSPHPYERRDVTITTSTWPHSLPRRQTAGTRLRTGRGGAGRGGNV